MQKEAYLSLCSMTQHCKNSEKKQENVRSKQRKGRNQKEKKKWKMRKQRNPTKRKSKRQKDNSNTEPMMSKRKLKIIHRLIKKK